MSSAELHILCLGADAVKALRIQANVTHGVPSLRHHVDESSNNELLDKMNDNGSVVVVLVTENWNNVDRLMVGKLHEMLAAVVKHKYAMFTVLTLESLDQLCDDLRHLFEESGADRLIHFRTPTWTHEMALLDAQLLDVMPPQEPPVSARVVARIVDGLLIFVMFCCLMAPVVYSDPSGRWGVYVPIEQGGYSETATAVFLYWSISALYHVAVPALFGETIGRRVVRVRLALTSDVSLSPSLKRRMLRWSTSAPLVFSAAGLARSDRVLVVLSGVSAIISIVSAIGLAGRLVDERRRVADLVASTLVVRSQSSGIKAEG